MSCSFQNTIEKVKGFFSKDRSKERSEERFSEDCSEECFSKERFSEKVRDLENHYKQLLAEANERNDRCWRMYEMDDEELLEIMKFIEHKLDRTRKALDNIQSDYFSPSYCQRKYKENYEDQRRWIKILETYLHN